MPCGLLDQAIMVQRTLLWEFGGKLDRVRLKTGHGGVFKVRVDGELVFDSGEDAYDENELKSAVGDRIPA